MTEVESVFLLYFYSNFLNQKLEENYYGKNKAHKKRWLSRNEIKRKLLWWWCRMEGVKVCESFWRALKSHDIVFSRNMAPDWLFEVILLEFKEEIFNWIALCDWFWSNLIEKVSITTLRRRLLSLITIK